METDTFAAIAADAYHLAAAIRTGVPFSENEDPTDGLEPDDIEALRQWRTIELIVGLGERIARLSGATVAVPDGVADMVDSWLTDVN